MNKANSHPGLIETETIKITIPRNKSKLDIDNATVEKTGKKQITNFAPLFNWISEQIEEMRNESDKKA